MIGWLFCLCFFLFSTIVRMSKGDADEDGIDRLARLEEVVIAQQKWLRFIACLLAFSTSLILVIATLLLPTLLQPFIAGTERGAKDLKDVVWKQEVSHLC